MTRPFILKSRFFSRLLSWHAKNPRNLPWKKTNNPYFIWLSEIILQQTRVEQGLPYYERFIKKFPIIKKLAEADEEEVLKIWEGLGYYSRARNLHFAAKQIMNDFGGKFPDSYEGIHSLKGIGDYTAAAIASFAFNLPHAVVDGNVVRVLSRVFGVKEDFHSSKGKKKFFQLANSLLHQKQPGAFNQALMNFGAMVCLPQNPKCATCIFKKDCYALNHNMVKKFPIKKTKTAPRIRYFNFLVLKKQKEIFIEKRNGSDIWKGLYQFPMIESHQLLQPSDLNKTMKKNSLPFKWSVTGISPIFKHQLSHQTLFAQFISAEISMEKFDPSSSYIKIRQKELTNFAFPKLLDNYIQKFLY